MNIPKVGPFAITFWAVGLVMVLVGVDAIFCLRPIGYICIIK
jgi:hypothetical protein